MRLGTLAVWCVVLGSLLLAPWGAAQVDAVRLTIGPRDVGLDGHVRFGDWVPMRLRLVNQSAEDRDVICRWTMRDSDGDRLMAERPAVLQAIPQEQILWLYALPQGLPAGQGWTVQVLDGASGDVLAVAQAVPQNVIDRGVNLIGVCGGTPVGLDAHANWLTQHEQIALVMDLSLSDLPDRWHGLSMLSALVWTSQDVLPDDPSVAPSVAEAAREWVRRGGRLVVSLPAFNETWTRSSLAPVLPVTQAEVVPQQVPVTTLGRVLGAPSTEGQGASLNVNALQPMNARAAVVSRGSDGEAYVVSGRHGFGAVTVVGIDLASPSVAAFGLPRTTPSRAFWNDVFGWRAPVMREDLVEAEVQQQRQRRVSQMQEEELGGFMPSRIAMSRTAAGPLLLAILLFGVYFLAAGPVMFFVLKRRDLAQWAWPGFALVVLGFTVFSWAGAWAMQNKRRTVNHFTVLDVDGNSGTARARSVMSLYVPDFDTVTVTIDPDALGEGGALLAGPAFASDVLSPGYLDTRTYRVEASDPESMGLPMRSTSRQLQADYMGPLDQATEGLAEPWGLISGQVGLKDDGASPRLEGTLRHGLPGVLTDVRIVACPGNGESPWIWPLTADWEPGADLDLSRLGAGQVLVALPRRDPGDDRWAERRWEDEGYLGQFLKRSTGFGQVQQYNIFGNAQPAVDIASDSDVVEQMERLTFYDSLPPPDFRIYNSNNSPFTYQRPQGRGFDLSALLDGRRILILGHLRESPLPMPMTVDGDTVQSTGWTTVRWVYDLPSAN